MTKEEAINEIKSWDFLEGKEIEAIYTLIPELKPSADERIRKCIEMALTDVKEQRFLDYGTSLKDCLYWLEKQKERGPLTKEEEYNLHRIIEFLEDETCPSEWISLLHDIYCLPYEKQKEKSIKMEVYEVGKGTTICGQDYKCKKDYKTSTCKYIKDAIYHCSRDGYLNDQNGVSWSCPPEWFNEYIYTNSELADKEKNDFVSGQFLQCKLSFDEFKEGEHYWLEYVGDDMYVGRSDNVLNQKFHITPRQLYTLFSQQLEENKKEPEDKGEISDGYHTFNELYYYRMLYNAAFFNLLPKEWVHKSKRHHDGEECFGGGWFVVMANLPTGQISNHYELKDWDLFQIPEKEIADEWDGHTPQEAAERIHKYLLEKQKENPKSTDSIPSDVKCENRWYKVKDSLPDNAREVLCKDAIGNFFIGRYYKKSQSWEVMVYDDCMKSNEYNPPVVKWCEIPSEKQKEQKTIFNIKQFGLNDFEEELFHLLRGMKYLNISDEEIALNIKNQIAPNLLELIQKEQKPIDYEAELKKCKDNPLYFFDKYVTVKIKQKPSERSLEDDHIIGFVYDLLNEIEWKDDWAMSKDECLRRLDNYRPQKPAEWDDYTKTNLGRAIRIIKDARGNLYGYQTDDGIYECDKAIEALEHFLYRGLEIEESTEWSEDYDEENLQTRFAFYTYKDDSNTLYLSNVFVEETSRNHGFGTKILAAAEKVAEAISATSIRLKVKRDNPAHAWYQKHGYNYITFEDEYDWFEKTLKCSKPVKQEWGEEDEKIRKTLLDYYEEALDNYTCVEWLNGITYGELCDWLKSIPERFNLRPKKELSIEKAIQWLDDTFYFLDNSSGRGRDCEITTHDFDSLEEMYDSFRKAVAVDSYPHWNPSEGPVWRIWENGACGNSDGTPIAIVKEGYTYRLVNCLGVGGEKYIMLSDLEKLPGFDKR